MKNKFILILFLFISCDNNLGFDNEKRLTFIASEGNFGSSNASISVFQGPNQIQKVSNIGDVIQSIKVYDDKLFVLINNSHKIKVYDITAEGLSMPGIEIDTEQSSPRELVIVNDKVYFTNWNTKDIKVLNLITHEIESFIQFNSIPEDIISDGTHLWVSLPMLELYDHNDGTIVSKIHIPTKQIVNNYDVGRGPEQLTSLNNEIYVSRKFSSLDWMETYHGVSVIGSDINQNDYLLGSPCGGSILSYNNKVFRSYGGGIAPIHANLEVDELGRIGNYDQTQIYHVEIINDNIWFGITNFTDLNEVQEIDANGNKLAIYKVGKNPGDFAYWSK